MKNAHTQPSNVALLVHTCDRYQFLYEGFAYFFNKYWDFDAHCQLYFATEQLSTNLPNFTNIQSGTGEWADRLRYLLTEVITEKYVIYFQEDMWLNKPVDARFFNELFNLVNQHGFKQVKLTSAGVYKTQTTPYYIEGFNVALLNNAESGYLMSHQVTLWDREFLAAQLHKGEHPWRNERRGTKRLKKLNPEIYQADYFAENGQPPVNTNLQLAKPSEYNTVSANSMLQSNVLPYVEELKKAGEAEQQYANELLHNYHNQLTHDGKSKPRKEDIFKKLKKLFK